MTRRLESKLSFQKKSKSKNESKKKKITSSRVPVVNVREITNGSEDSALVHQRKGTSMHTWPEEQTPLEAMISH